jgi:nicotinate-nucleotide adenylyltransferase
VPEDFSGAAAGRVLLVPLTQLDISATRLRDLIADDRDPRYLMPDRVRDYVLGQQLYRGKDPYQTQHVE